MSQDPSVPDPFEQMRQAYDEAVGGWAKTMEQMVGTQDFAAASSEFLKRYVELQENIRATSKATADALHLPTKDDFARIAQLVINVERKVDEVSDNVHEVASRPEPASPEATLAAIAGRLEAIEKTLAEVAARPEHPSAEAPLTATAEHLGAIETTLAELAARPVPSPAPSKASPAPSKAAETPKAAAETPKKAAATSGTTKRRTRAPKAS